MPIDENFCKDLNESFKERYEDQRSRESFHRRMVGLSAPQVLAYDMKRRKNGALTGIDVAKLDSQMKEAEQQHLPDAAQDHDLKKKSNLMGRMLSPQYLHGMIDSTYRSELYISLQKKVKSGQKLSGMEKAAFDSLNTIIERSKTDLSRTEPAVELTLKSLQRRGYCVETDWDSFIERALSVTDGAASWWADTVDIADMEWILKENDEGVFGRFSEDPKFFFMKGIEATVANKNLSAFADKDRANYIGYCESNIASVYTYAIIFSVIYYLSEKCVSFKERVDAAKKSEEFAKQEAKEVKAKIREVKKTCNEELVYNLRAALRKETDERMKAISSRMKLEKKIAALERKIERLEHPEVGSEEDDAEIDRILEEAEAPAVIQKAKDYPIPQDGVVYLGGHVNLVTKLKKKYPKWRFIACDEKCKKNWIASSANAGKVSLLIVNSSHLAHSVFEKVFDSLPDTVPVAYVDSVNLNVFEQDLQEEWNRCCHNAV